MKMTEFFFSHHLLKGHFGMVSDFCLFLFHFVIVGFVVAATVLRCCLTIYERSTGVSVF